MGLRIGLGHETRWGFSKLVPNFPLSSLSCFPFHKNHLLLNGIVASSTLAYPNFNKLFHGIFLKHFNAIHVK